MKPGLSAPTPAGGGLDVGPGRLEAGEPPPGDGGPVLELLEALPGEDDTSGLRRRAQALSADLGRGRLVSRAYAFPYGLVAHHTAAVGVGVERVVACDLVFAASICSPRELDSLRLDDAAAVVSLWSAKAALAKALGDARLYDLRRLASPVGWAGGASGPWRARALQPAPGYRGWVCWRAGDVSGGSDATGRR